MVGILCFAEFVRSELCHCKPLRNFFSIFHSQFFNYFFHYREDLHEDEKGYLHSTLEDEAYKVKRRK